MYGTTLRPALDTSTLVMCHVAEPPTLPGLVQNPLSPNLHHPSEAALVFPDPEHRWLLHADAKPFRA
jgi:hypothetical protein